MNDTPAPDDNKTRDSLPPLNALRSFDAVARLGSFAAAAADLHVTHWAVGKQVRLLEDWFGVPLFERRARGVVLTDAGAALLDDVSGAFGRLSASVARLRQPDAARRIAGVVRVNVLPSFAMCWLLPRLAAFHARYPDIEVRLTTTSRKLRYIGDAFDVGVRSGDAKVAGVASRPLMADLRLPACNPALLQRHPVRTVADLRQHALLHAASTRGAWDHWLEEAGMPALRAVRHIEFEHTYLQLTAAVEGLGMALASLPLIGRDIAAGRLVCPLPGPLWRAPDYTLALNGERAADDAVKAFEEWIVTMAARDEA